MKALFFLLGVLGLFGCRPQIDRISDGLFSLNQQDPTLSGNGNQIALIVEKQGKPTVEMRNLKDGRIIYLRNLSRYQPHSSPSLSWSGRYLALIAQKTKTRFIIIKDRISGKLHHLRVPGNSIPIRLSLSPDASNLALQLINQGKFRVQIFDLSHFLEPDLPQRIRSQDL